MNIQLYEQNFRPVSQIKSLFTDDADRYIGETITGERKEQVIPVIYLDKTSIDELSGGIKVSKSKQKFTEFDSDIDDSLVYPGYSLKISSFENKLVFMIERANSLLARGFDPAKSGYYIFETVPRDHVVNFRKVGTSKFYGVKAKNSVQFAANTRRAARGLIGVALHAGISKGFGKIEDDIELRTGFKYELKYLKDGIEKTMMILCDEVYSLRFEKFLDYNWKTEKPAVPERKEKGGCFIATATMGNYNHFLVLQLRDFRDEYLSRRTWGRKFINLYYSYSPKCANTISKHRSLRLLSYLFIVRPVGVISRLMSRLDR